MIVSAKTADDDRGATARAPVRLIETMAAPRAPHCTMVVAPLALAIAIGGCTDPPPPPPATPTKASTESTPPAKTNAALTNDEAVFLQTSPTGARVAAPLDYVPLAAHESERLRTALLRQQPLGTAAVVGRKSSQGFSHGMVSSVSLDNQDLPSIYGATIRDLGDLVLRYGELMGRELPDSAAPQFRLKPDPNGRFIDVVMTMKVAQRGEFRSLTRMWSDADALYHEAGCQCSGSGCAFGERGCTLPVPGPDALSIDATIDGGRAPVELSTPRGGVTVKIPPFFEPMPAAELAQINEADESLAKLPKHVDTVASVGPHTNAGVVMLRESSWCANRKLPCTLAEVEEAIIDAAEADGVALQAQPRITREATTDGPPGRLIEVQIGQVLWSRHRVWSEGRIVREQSCMCGAQACAIVETSCTLKPS